MSAYCDTASDSKTSAKLAWNCRLARSKLWIHVFVHPPSQDFVEPTCAVMGKAYVHSPAEFAAAPESEGNDVFLCDYEYDEAWKRFRKRRYGDAAADDMGTVTAYPQTPAGAPHACACCSVWLLGAAGD